MEWILHRKCEALIPGTLLLCFANGFLTEMMRVQEEVLLVPPILRRSWLHGVGLHGTPFAERRLSHHVLRRHGGIPGGQVAFPDVTFPHQGDLVDLISKRRPQAE